MSDTVQIGSSIYIRYKGGAAGEEIIDDRSSGEPLHVVVGDMSLPRGIELALIDMEAGQTKQVEIEPELGYGQYQEKYAQWYPRPMMDNGYNLKVGDFLWYNDHKNAAKRPAWVTDETEDNVKIDFNHPLAGKTLSYWLEVVEID